MKKSKSALLKSPENSTANNETTHAQKEIELLVKKLNECRKKYNVERKKNKTMDNFNCDLLKENLHLEEINKKERAKSKLWHGSFSGILSAMKMSADNYLNLLLMSKNNNLYPSFIEIEKEKAALKQVMDTLYALTKKSDLLASHKLSEFLDNKN